MKIGDAIVDFNALIIHRDGEEQFVEPKIMKVLEALINNAGKVVTREKLIDEIWGIGYGTDERLTRAIYILRKALKDTGKPSRYIRTIPKTGYQLIADISASSAPVNKEQAKHAEEKPIAFKTEQPEQAAQTQVKQASYFGRIMVSTVSALLVFAIISFFNYNRSTLSTEKIDPSIAAGLDGIYNYTGKGAIAEAQENFELMLAEDPDDAAARAGLALALIREYTHLERDPALLNRAHSAAEAALRNDNNLGLANIAVGWTAEFRGEYDRAHKLLDRAEILDPKNKLIYESRARVFYKTAKYQDAQETVETALEFHPEYTLFYSYLGQFNLRENDLQGAEDSFRKVLELSNGKNARAYGQLAHILHHQGETEAAIQTLQEGLKINQTSDLYTNLGTYLYFQGQYEMAANAFERTLEFTGDTHSHLYWANLADAYRQIPGKTKASAQAYKRAIQLLEIDIKNASENATYHSRLALYNAKSGEIDLAREQLTKLDRSSLTTSSDLFRLALIYEVISERELAISYLGKAMQAGYTMTEIMHEPELDRLRQDKDFHLLLASMEKTNE